MTSSCSGLGTWLACLACVAACSDSGRHAGDDASVSDASRADGSAASDPCPSGVVEGDYVIETDDDAAAVADCTEVTGDLTVSGDVNELGLPALTTVGGSLRVLDTTALPLIELPALVTVTRDFEVNANAKLARFAAPVLESCTVIGFVDNTELAELDVGALTRTGFVRLQRNAALRQLSVPHVAELGVFFVTENASLESVSFEDLTTITIDGFIVSLNPVLTTLSLPVLTNVFGDILMANNPRFPTCRAEQIRDQVDDPSVPIVIMGNDDSASCP